MRDLYARLVLWMIGPALELHGERSSALEAGSAISRQFGRRAPFLSMAISVAWLPWVLFCTWISIKLLHLIFEGA